MTAINTTPEDTPTVTVTVGNPDAPRGYHLVVLTNPDGSQVLIEFHPSRTHIASRLDKWDRWSPPHTHSEATYEFIPYPTEGAN